MPVATQCPSIAPPATPKGLAAAPSAIVASCIQYKLYNCSIQSIKYTAAPSAIIASCSEEVEEGEAGARKQVGQGGTRGLGRRAGFLPELHLDYSVPTVASNRLIVAHLPARNGPAPSSPPSQPHPTSTLSPYSLIPGYKQRRAPGNGPRARVDQI